MKKTILVMILVFIWLNAESKTGLKWQDSYPNNEEESMSLEWKDAVLYCHNLEIDDDKGLWKLPNVKELLSLEVRDVEEEGFIYWSSTTLASNELLAWGVDVNSKTLVKKKKKTMFYVRCVR